MKKQVKPDMHEKWQAHTVQGKQVWMRHHAVEGTNLAPIVITTGPVASGPQLDPLMHELMRQYSGPILAIEVPGQGKSQQVRKRRHVKDYAHEMRDAIRVALGQTVTPILVGHCFGADVMHALSKEMEVKGTVMLNSIPTETLFGLSNPVLRFNLRTLWNVFVKIPLRKTQALKHKLHMADVIEPTKYNSPLLKTLKSLVDLVRVWTTKKYEPTKNNSPTLLVAGQYDIQSTKEGLEEVAKRMTNVTVDVVEDSGHMTIIVQPQRVAEMIVEFARKVNTPQDAFSI